MRHPLPSSPSGTCPITREAVISFGTENKITHCHLVVLRAATLVSPTFTMSESAVSLKLPTFWTSQPRAWFIQAEAQFNLRSISNDKTKYSYLVAALDQRTAERLIDILENAPEEDKYNGLKDRLLNTFALTRQQRASRLLSISGLGDRRPSELMDEMLALLGDHKPCLLFEELFRQQLPADVRMTMANADFSDPRAAAQLADQLWLSRPQPFAAAVDSTEEQDVAAVHQTDRDQRRHSKACYFHRRFGAKARQCTPPCNQGNGLAGRR
jgi:hypothetical protein